MKAKGFHSWRFGTFVVETTTILLRKNSSNSAQKAEKSDDFHSWRFGAFVVETTTIWFRATGFAHRNVPFR